jgi:hypothetical protein
VVAWAIYAARVTASVFLGFLSAVSALAATFGDRTWFMVGSAAGLGLVAFATWPKSPNAWRRDPPTERQIAYALDLGIPIPPGVSKGELSDMISQATGR